MSGTVSSEGMSVRFFLITIVSVRSPDSFPGPAKSGGDEPKGKQWCFVSP